MPEPDANRPKIALLGIPIEIGASQPGTLMGPAALRTAGIGRILGQLGFAVEDHGDMTPSSDAPAEGSPPANAKYYDEIKGWIRALSKRSFLLARSGAIPIFMGGDHSLSMGSVNGVARYWREKGQPLFVLWLDAHADYNTPQTTETGNMHGMSAAFLCGESGLDGPDLPFLRWNLQGRSDRFKLRIRAYGNDIGPLVYAEIKSKTGSVVRKQRADIPVTLLTTLLGVGRPDPAFLLKTGDSSVVSEFVRRRQHFQAEPKMLITCLRRSLRKNGPGGEVAVTMVGTPNT